MISWTGKVFSHLSPLPRFLFAITSKSSLLLVKNHHYFDHFIYMVLWYYGIYTYNIQYSNFSLQNWGVVFSAYHTNWKPKLNDRLQSLLPRNVLLNIMDIISFSVAAAPSGRQTTICDELSDGISESSRGESSTLSLVLLWALRGLKI